MSRQRTTAHAVLEALNEHTDEEPRVTKTESDSYAPQRFSLDTSGCTAIQTLLYLHNVIFDAEA